MTGLLQKRVSHAERVRHGVQLTKLVLVPRPALESNPRLWVVVRRDLHSLEQRIQMRASHTLNPGQ